MLHRSLRILAGVAVCSIALAVSTAWGADDPRYPDFSGQWARIPVPGLSGQPSYDPNKSWGRGQEAPLTPEYQAVLDSNIKDQQNGGHGHFLGWTCMPYGMPMMMYGFPAAGIRGHAQDDLHPDRPHGRVPPRLHRQTQLAERDRAELPGIFGRPMGRRE